MNLKFMSMAAIAAMTLCTACSEDDNTPNPEPPVADAYSSELFLTVAKLLQKSEMRKDIVIELSYKGFG